MVEFLCDASLCQATKISDSVQRCPHVLRPSYLYPLLGTKEIAEGKYIYPRSAKLKVTKDFLGGGLGGLGGGGFQARMRVS